MAPLSYLVPADFNRLSLHDIESLPEICVSKSPYRFYEYNKMLNLIVKVHIVTDASTDLRREADTMRRAKKLTGIDAIPTVHRERTYHAYGRAIQCLLMERKQGVPLSEAWSHWDDVEKSQFVSNLFDLMKGFRCHTNDTAAALDRTSPLQDKFFDFIKDPTFNAGPFCTEAAFIHALKLAFEKRASSEHFGIIKHLLLDLACKQAMRYHKNQPSFQLTHGNLADNILVKSEADSTITGLVGWRQAGYYPQWWEMVKILVDYETVAAEAVQFLPNKFDMQSEYVGVMMLAFQAIY